MKKLSTFVIVLYCIQSLAALVDFTSPPLVGGGAEIKTYRAAQNFCTALGTRLPTIREFADYAAYNGAKGILEAKYPALKGGKSDPSRVELERMRLGGYEPVVTDGRCDSSVCIQFYYNPQGYKPANKDFEDVYFWASDLYMEYAPSFNL